MDETQWKASNAEFWDRGAARWRALGLPTPENATLWSRDVPDLVDELACPPGALLLDVGCGAGLWSVALAQAGYRVRGVDISPQMVAQARQLAEEHGIGRKVLDFEIGAADQIDVADGTFDGVICRAVLDFVPSPGAALLELWRVLRPGHRLFLSVIGAHSPLQRTAWRRFLPGSPAPLPVNHILPWEAEALLEEMGWEIVSQRANMGPAASGATNEYTREMIEQLDNRILQQTLASLWEFIAVKPK